MGCILHVKIHATYDRSRFLLVSHDKSNNVTLGQNLKWAVHQL